MTIHWHFEKSSPRVVATGGSDKHAGSRGTYALHGAETLTITPRAASRRFRQTARSFGSGPFLHGMTDIREFATACFVWGCVAAGGLALFVAWFVAATLIYWE